MKRRMFKGVAVAAALLLAAPVAQAQAQAVSHGKALADLEACIEAAPMPDDIAGCTGAAARACEAAVPGEPTVDRSVRCMEAEADAWETVLETALAARREILAGLDAGRKPADGGLARVARLEQAQAAWRTWRLAECGHLAAEFLGDSMADYTAAACLMNMTADRALDLMMLEAY